MGHFARLAVGVAIVALAGCGTLRAGGSWVASSLLAPLAPDLDADEDCDEQPHLVPAAQGERRLRIGTWNMHYLGPSEERPEERRDPRRIAEYLRVSGVSVLAIQEIGAPAAPEPRSAMLDAVFAELRAGGADWTYRLHGARDDPSQYVGVAWDRVKVTQVEPALDLDEIGLQPSSRLPLLGPSDTWRRKPFAIKLSAGAKLTDIVVVPVHLTARTETYFLEDATAHREAECEALAQQLRRVRDHFRDDDVVVIGDFNVELDTEEVGDALLERGWRDLNCADHRTYVGGLALDRIFVPARQPEFGLEPNFWRVVPPQAPAWGEFLEHYSDHLLVVADVIVVRDDD